MNSRTHTHIYIKLQPLVVKNFCTIKLGFICKYIALKQNNSALNIYFRAETIKLHECSFPLIGVLSFFFFNLSRRQTPLRSEPV